MAGIGNNMSPCSRTAPSPTALASVCNTNRAASVVNCGNANTGACVNLYFSSVKVVMHSGVHEKVNFAFFKL